MRRDYLNVGIIWFALTFVGELFVPAMARGILPLLASEEGQLIDEAFEFLLMMSIPVFAFVIVALVYSAIRFRDRGEEREVPPDRGSQTVYLIWLVVTGLLAIIILIHPGITGLAELRAEAETDLEIQVVAEKWNWDFIYPEYGITLEAADELVVPADTRIRFEVSSLDILHSFWVPAFRMKIDAVPGLTTVLYVTPTTTGTFGDDSMFRVQCAELCGTGHARMRAAVVVLEPAEFEAWAAEQAGLIEPVAAGK